MEAGDGGQLRERVGELRKHFQRCTEYFGGVKEREELRISLRLLSSANGWM